MNTLGITRARFGKRGPGFTLVEVTVAIGIVAFCFLALLGLLQAGLKQERQSVDQTRASHILTAVLNDCERMTRNSSGGGANRFGLPFPNTQALSEKTFLVGENGELAADAQSPGTYAVYFRSEAPAQAARAYKPYKVRTVVAWPASAVWPPEENGTPKWQKASGTVEAILELNHE